MCAACIVAALSLSVLADPTLTVEDFSVDPKWEGRNNVRTERGREKKQDFGYSATNFAGGAPGEIGGWICRSIRPSTYSTAIATKTFSDRLSASGAFAVTQSEGGSGMLIGWFNSASRGWRTPNALLMRIDGESNKFRIFYEYGTQHWMTGGGQIFEGDYQTNPKSTIPAGKERHTWKLDYDPNGANDDGELIFLFDGVEYRSALAPGHKADGAMFDRFGIINQQIHGDHLVAYHDDLVVDGQSLDFSADSGWEGINNHGAFEDIALRPVHDFGFRPTNHAGGQPGEIGGYIWRIESTLPDRAGYYAAPIENLSLDQELTASGKVSFASAGVDSGLIIGWFNSHTAIGAPPANVLGVLVEGPSRIGHYFRPVFGSSDDRKALAEAGPIIYPNNASRIWTLRYDPNALDGQGQITVTLDTETVTLDLPKGARRGNATFDRFGVLSWQRGGHFVEMYFDDLAFTGKRNP